MREDGLQARSKLLQSGKVKATPTQPHPPILWQVASVLITRDKIISYLFQVMLFCLCVPCVSSDCSAFLVSYNYCTSEITFYSY